MVQAATAHNFLLYVKVGCTFTCVPQHEFRTCEATRSMLKTNSVSICNTGRRDIAKHGCHYCVYYPPYLCIFRIQQVTAPDHISC